MTDIAAAGPHKIDISKEGGVDLLQGKAVGLVGVLFLTVTGAAPMTAMLGNVPFAAGFGNGMYTPAAFLLATIVLTIFSIGYAAMARKVSSVGGFYAFISQGLGRELGMSAGLVSFASYSVFEASLTGIFAFFANSWLSSHFGINIPWNLSLAVRNRTLRHLELSGRPPVGEHPGRCPRAGSDRSDHL